jgi:hypothetical protein
VAEVTDRSAFDDYLDASAAMGADPEPMGPFDDPRVAEATQTCFGCPDQYEGRLHDGREFYFRYRHGSVYLGVGNKVVGARRGTLGESRRSLGDSLQGVFDSPEQRDAMFTLMLDDIDDPV